jgi:ribosomal protein S12 methylthiotransferase accessory factor
MTRAFYPKYPDWQKIAAHRLLIAEGHRTVHYHTLVEQNADGSGDRLSALLARLTDCGVSVVNVVRIDTTPLIGLAVARVIVPALMPLMEH